MVERSDYLFSRRRTLACGGIMMIGSIAGCSGNDTDEPAEAEQDENDTESTEQQSSDTGSTPESANGCGPGETALDSFPALNTNVTVAGEVSRIDSGANLLYITDGTGIGAIQAGGNSNAQDYAQGDCVTATGYVTDIAGTSGDPDGAVYAYEVRTPEEINRNVLEQSLPDPSQYINSGQSGFERAVGTVEITTTPGDSELRLQGPGQNQVTAIAGYVDGAGLSPRLNWGGSADEESKRIHTSAGGGMDDLGLDLFRGVALKAVDGINLVVDGTTVAERVQLVRYRKEDGVFEEEPVQ